MKSIVIVLALVACGGASPERKATTPKNAPERAAPLVIGFPKLRVGETTLIERRTVSRQTDGKQQAVIETNIKARSTLLAMTDGIPTKASVVYEQFSTKATLDGAEAPVEHRFPDLSGVTLVVERVDGKPVVTKQPGEISDTERRHALLHLGSFGTRTQVEMVLATTTWIVGNPVSVGLAEGTGLATLLSYDDQTARFEVIVASKKPELRVEIRWAIEIDRRDGRIATSDARTRLTEPGEAPRTLDLHVSERLAD